MAVSSKTIDAETSNPNPTGDADMSAEDYAEAEKHVDVVEVPSLNADGSVDQTPGYVTLAKGEDIPDRVTPAGLVKGVDVANHPDEKAGSKASDTKKSGSKSGKSGS